jgi:hypothetical protein
MTEAEWLACTDPRPMLELEFLRGGKTSYRKLRLFAVACCQLIRRLFLDQRILLMLDGLSVKPIVSPRTPIVSCWRIGGTSRRSWAKSGESLSRLTMEKRVVSESAPS